MIQTRLETRRKTLVRAITFHAKKAMDLDENSLKSEAANRYALLERTYKEFTAVLNDLEKLDDYDGEANCEENLYIDNKYIESISLMQELTKTVDEEPHNSTMHTNYNTAEFQLPKIQIAYFNGKYEDWPSFQDLFLSSINSSERLTNAQKMHHLKSLLKGDAAQTIKHLAITNDNYATAMKMLKERYDNKRAIVNSHLKNLFSLPKLNSAKSAGIKNMSSTINECLQALSALKVSTLDWDPFIVFLAEGKMDINTKKEWEYNLRGSSNIPKLKDLTCFLDVHFRMLESAELACFESSPSSLMEKKPQAWPVSDTHVQRSETQRTYPCHFCKETAHRITACPSFLSKSAAERLKFIRSKGICENCFSSAHKMSDCTSLFKCRACGSKEHHSLLHQGQNISTNVAEIFDNEVAINDDDHCEDNRSINEDNLDVFHANLFNTVMLATALIGVRASVNAPEIKIRVLLDQGSQGSFISENVAQRLKLRRTKANIAVSGVGNSKSAIVKHTVELNIFSLRNKFNQNMTAMVTKSIATIKSQPHMIKRDWSHIQGLELADPRYEAPGNIDMLIGADMYGQILLPGLKKGPINEPTAQNTEFGWIISGKTRANNPSNSVVTLSSFINLDHQLRKFWELEEVERIATFTEEEERCEQHFIETHRRDENGRYVVRLPFKSTNKRPQFFNTRNLALRRLIMLENRFKRDPLLREKYNEYMSEYLELGFMELSKVQGPVDVDCYFMPHHAVMKETSSTTKTRIVLDASAKDANKKSLNNTLLVGPTIQPKLSAIILQWRLYKFVFSTDIQKMYLQITLDERDRNFQQIVWRFSLDEPFKNYTLNTLTFGTANAAFQAVRSIKQLTIDERQRFPSAAADLMKSSYIDDVYMGASTILALISKRKELVGLTGCGQLKLRKWIANHASILQGIPEEHCEQLVNKNLDEMNVIRTLGIQWNPVNDCFNFTVHFDENRMNDTKRQFLSQISSIYDPLGWLAPATINLKMILQKIWLRGTQWDAPLPSDLLNEWNELKQDFNHIKDLSVPRWLETLDDLGNVSLHGFCDASLLAYSAVVFLRANLHDTCKITIVAAKTKVAPLKDNTIPRLELCAALLLAELLQHIRTVIAISDTQVFAWSDSQVALAWIKGAPNRWKTFVCNRVNQIQSIIAPEHWRYVPSEENSADCASRGIKPSLLKSHSLWWNGPKWLEQGPDSWPQTNLSVETDLEKRKENINVTTAQANENNVDCLLAKFSSLEKLIRVTAYCLRIVKFLRFHKRKAVLQNHNDASIQPSRVITPLSAAETKVALLLNTEEKVDALRFWVKHVQGEQFHPEINKISNSLTISKKSKIANLNPFIDTNGVLRVGGRLKHSILPYQQRHPQILSGKSHLTELLIRSAHECTLHSGTKNTLSYIRKRFWIVNGKNTVRFQIRKCVTCAIHAAKIPHQLMASLPSPRVNPSHCFQHTGVDFAGPLDVKSSHLRKAPYTKAYIALFVCLSTKAIHIELVSNLSTQGFIAAFKRFVSRRGLCSDLYCDNATNFLGASNEFPRLLFDLREQQGLEIANELLKDDVNFHFSPPRSPNFGGLWESGVKSAKGLLKRTLGNAKLTFEEMYTVLTQIEACLNSRPLSALTNDCDDLDVLSPAHFLIQRPLNISPEPCLLDENINRLSRWQYVQRLTQQFWRQWSNEYLSDLQRNKWKSSSEPLYIGEIVLIRDDNLPPTKWLKGRVVQTFTGADNEVRVAEIKTKTSVMKRAISQICRLPVPNEV